MYDCNLEVIGYNSSTLLVRIVVFNGGGVLLGYVRRNE